MHISKLLLFAVASYSSLLAESPFVGTWKQNFDKSFTSTPEALRSATIRIEASSENRVRITQESLTKEGKQQRVSGVHVLDGSDAGNDADTSGFTQSFLPVNRNVWERVAKSKGEVLRRGYWAISNDGKLMIITGFGKESNGQQYYFQRVLERQ